MNNLEYSRIKNLNIKSKSITAETYVFIKLVARKEILQHLENEKADKSWLVYHMLKIGNIVQKSKANFKIIYSFKTGSLKLDIMKLWVE